MTTELRNFLEIPYDELEQRNIEAKEKVLKRESDDSLRDYYIDYLKKEKRIKALTVSSHRMTT
jgi:glutamine synthetase